jgi:hypothetical protein
VLVHQAPCSFGLSDPLLDGRQVVNVLWMQEGFHDATICMPTDNNVGNLLDGHRVFYGRGAAALHRAIGRHHIDTLCRFGQLTLGRRQHTFQTNEYLVPYDKGLNVVRTCPMDSCSNSMMAVRMAASISPLLRP